MSLGDGPVHTVDVSDPTEARQALDAAETLGLELRDVRVRGRWIARSGAAPSRGSTWSLSDKTLNAHTWFYLHGNGYDRFATQPRTQVEEDLPLGAGRLELRFD